MNIKIGFINLGNHSVARRAVRGSVLSLVAAMALSAVFCPVALAAGAFDNVTIASDGPVAGIDGVLGDAGPVVTFSHAIGGGGDRILVVGTSAEGIGIAFDIVVSSVTYNGVAMTATGSAVADNGPGLLATLHYMLETDLPAAGSYDVVVTYSTGTISMSAAALSLENFVQQAPEATASSAAPNNDGTTSADITTLTANAWLVNLVGAGDSRVTAGDFFISNSGMTIRADEEIGTQDAVIATKIVATPGTQAISWDYPTPNRMAQVIAAFEEIPDPPPVFSIQPVGGTREVGDSHTFEVALFAPVGTVSHQWKKDGGNVGTDSSTLALTNLQLSDSGQYSVDVTDDTGTFIAGPVTLTVIEQLPAAGLWALIFVAALLLVSGTYLIRRRVTRR